MAKGSVTVTGFQDLAGNAACSRPGTRPWLTRSTSTRLNPTATVNIVDPVLNDADNSSAVTFSFSEPVAQDSVRLRWRRDALGSYLVAEGTAATAIFTADDDFDGEGRVTVTGFRIWPAMPGSRPGIGLG